MTQKGASLLYLLVASLVISLLITSLADNLVTNMRIQHNREQHQHLLQQAEQLTHTVKQHIDRWMLPPPVQAHCATLHCVLPMRDNYQQQPLTWWQQHAQRLQQGYYLVQQLHAFDDRVVYRISVLRYHAYARVIVSLTVNKPYADDHLLKSQSVGWWLSGNCK